MSDFEELIKYCKKNKISGESALRIIKSQNETGVTGSRSYWKMIRFQMYIWERLEEYKKKKLGSRAQTVRNLVGSKEYKQAHKQFNKNDKFDERLEFKRLNQLISEPRQELVWQSKNFTYYGKPTENIPQDLLDKLR